MCNHQGGPSPDRPAFPQVQDSRGRLGRKHLLHGLFCFPHKRQRWPVLMPPQGEIQ